MPSKSATAKAAPATSKQRSSAKPSASGSVPASRASGKSVSKAAARKPVNAAEKDGRSTSAKSSAKGGKPVKAEPEKARAKAPSAASAPTSGTKMEARSKAKIPDAPVTKSKLSAHAPEKVSEKAGKKPLAGKAGKPEKAADKKALEKKAAPPPPPMPRRRPMPMPEPPKPPTMEERSATIEKRLLAAGDAFLKSYEEQLNMSWIYHDSAIEGVVYTYAELRAALDPTTPAVVSPESSLQPVCEEIRRHLEALDYIRDYAKKSRLPVNLDVVKKIYLILHPEEGDIKSVKYRKDIPQHRLYFHEYAAPDKIAYKVRQIVDWINEPETKKGRNSMRIATRAHYDLLRVFPFATDSGKVARLLMNLLLLRAGYPPAIVHSTERQRYYEALKGANAGHEPDRSGRDGEQSGLDREAARPARWAEAARELGDDRFGLVVLLVLHSTGAGFGSLTSSAKRIKKVRSELDMHIA